MSGWQGDATKVRLVDQAGGKKSRILPDALSMTVLRRGKRHRDTVERIRREIVGALVPLRDETVGQATREQIIDRFVLSMQRAMTVINTTRERRAIQYLRE